MPDAIRPTFIQGLFITMFIVRMLLPTFLTLIIGNTALYAQDKRRVTKQRTSDAKIQTPGMSEARQLLRQADSLANEGKFEDAIKALESALTIYQKERVSNDLNVAKAANDLGVYYFITGNYERPEGLFKRAIDVREKALGRGHLDVAESLSNLASLYQERGDYVRPESLFKRALTIRQKQLGVRSPKTASTMNNLAGLYDKRGDYRRAEEMYKSAADMQEHALGTGSTELADTLSNLAYLYYTQGDLERAEPLLRRALSIREKKLGPEDPSIANTLSLLAAVNFDRGNLDIAEPLFVRALSIEEKELGSEHPVVMVRMQNLADLYRLKGEYDRADDLYRRSLVVQEKALGTSHPDYGRSLLSYGLLYEAEGDLTRALELYTRSSEISENTLTLLLTAGSEEQKRLFINTLNDESDIYTSFHIHTANQSADAATLSLSTLLRRKGRVLDAMSDLFGSVRRRLDEQNRKLAEELARTRAQRARMLYASSGQDAGRYQAVMSELEAKEEKLEGAISARSVEFRTQSQPITLEGVQKAIPEGSTLIELVRYRPFFVKKTRLETFGVPRYAAYVLRHDGPILWADLGDASAIDEDVSRLRKALGTPTSVDVKRLARNLDEKVMRPIRGLLGETRVLFISPDGSLNLIPFGALVDENGKYLIENYSITYLSSGRDLLRLQTPAQSRQPPVVFADPMFSLRRTT